MNKSLWLDELEKKAYPKLERDLDVDVLVVGCGITGLTAGLLLIEEGYKVGIVDANRFFHNTTGNTTAKVTTQHGLIYHQMIRDLGFEKTQMYVKSHHEAMNQIESMINEYEIECDYEHLPAIIYTRDDKYVDKIEKEYEAALKLDIDAYYTEHLNLPYQVKNALGYKNQAQFHVTKYLRGLLDQFEKNDDGYLFEETKVVRITEENDVCHSFLENGKKIKSTYVIVASHYPPHNKCNLYFTKLKPYSAYIIAAETKTPLEAGMYINAEQPTRSLRTQSFKDKELILFAGESHKTGNFKEDANTHYDNLYQFGDRYFGINKVWYKWMTQDFETFDKVPLIGKINNDAKNVFVATGFKKWGMLSSNVGASMIRDLITKKRNEYVDLYRPSRLSDKLYCSFYNYNIGSGLKLITGRLKKAEKDFDVSTGKGKIISYKGKKYGVYKDEAGETFIVDVVCPHLKCILEFNHAEKTYDCPCHGSRFTYKGKYLDGPSIKDLKRINFKKG